MFDVRLKEIQYKWLSILKVILNNLLIPDIHMQILHYLTVCQRDYSSTAIQLYLDINST